MKNLTLFIAGFLVAWRWFHVGTNTAQNTSTTTHRLPPVNRPGNLGKSSGGWPDTLHLAHLKKSLGVVALLITLVSISLTRAC